MSLKQEIETWVTALQHYDNNEFEESVREFEGIAETSRIQFNLGVINATLGQHKMAVGFFQRAIKLDMYLAIAYFQQGVSNFLMEDFEEALANFNDTLLYLRGNTVIDYEQLGLKHRLYSCEVLFNRGMCYMYLGQKQAGMQDFAYASKEKQNELHNVIDDAIKEEADGYTVFSIPVGLVYRPNEQKVKNLKSKDYLGKARLVAALDKNNAYTGFSGAELKKIAQEAPQTRDDRAMDGVSYAATNLVKPNLSSRTRQHSEPPVSRSMFPPTPPPEAEKPGANLSMAASLFNRNPSINGNETISRRELPTLSNVAERPRLGTVRTASEPRPANKFSNTARPLGLSTTRSRQGGPTPLRLGRGNSNMVLDEKDEDEAMAEDLYDMYRPSRTNSSTSSKQQMPIRQASSRSANTASSRRNQYIPSDSSSDKMDEDDYSDQDQFEMMPPKRRPSRPSSSHSHSREPAHEMTKIRLKAHFNSQTKYIMVHGADMSHKDLMDKVRAKFRVNRCRISVQDEDGGETVEINDQDDVETIVETAMSISRRDRCDMGKVEIWVESM